MIAHDWQKLNERKYHTTYRCQACKLVVVALHSDNLHEVRPEIGCLEKNKDRLEELTK
jgi:hypothetical protein